MASVAAAGASTAMVKKLMQRSGLDDQIVQIPAQFQAGLTEAQAQQPQLSTEESSQLTGMMVAAFDARSLHADTERYIKAQMSDADIKQVLEWLDSPLGKKITALESAAATPEGMTAMQGQMESLLRRSDRVALTEEFDKAARVTDATINLINNMQVALTAAMMAQLPKEQQLPIEALQQIVQENEANMRAMMEPQIQASLLYTYQSLSDEELERYIAFANSEAGQRYHAVSIDALGFALINASKRFAVELMSYFSQPA